MATEQKTDGEISAEYNEMLEKLEAQKAEDYAEAGTLPPGVVTRNPDTTTPEANYVSRDNIVVSGASPAHIQAAVESLATDESRDKALDAADIAQSVSREEYDAAILAAAPQASEAQRDAAESEVVDLRDDDAHDPEDPRASGGAQVPEGTLEAVQEQLEDDDESDGEPFDASPEREDDVQPEAPAQNPEATEPQTPAQPSHPEPDPDHR